MKATLKVAETLYARLVAHALDPQLPHLNQTALQEVTNLEQEKRSLDLS